MNRCAVLSMLALLLIAGCEGGYKPKSTGQKPGLPQASDDSALAVAGQSITCDQIIKPLIERLRPIAQGSDLERFKEQARPELEQALVDRIAYVLLYHQAKRDVGEHIDEALEKAAEREVTHFVLNQFDGDYARAQQALKQQGMDWDSFKESRKKLILIVQQLPAPRPITYSELLDRYNEMKDQFFVIPAVIKFQLLDIEPAKLQLADPNQSRLEHARELAHDLVRRLRLGEDFSALAAEYPGVAFIRFSEPVQPQSLAQPYDILAAEAQKTEPGDIIGPIETERKDHIFIMKLEEKSPKSFKPFKKVQRQVEDKIIYDRRKQAAEELDARLARQVAVGEKRKFINFCLEKIYQRTNQ